MNTCIYDLEKVWTQNIMHQANIANAYKYTVSRWSCTRVWTSLTQMKKIKLQNMTITLRFSSFNIRLLFENISGIRPTRRQERMQNEKILVVIVGKHNGIKRIADAEIKFMPVQILNNKYQCVFRMPIYCNRGFCKPYTRVSAVIIIRAE